MAFCERCEKNENTQRVRLEDEFGYLDAWLCGNCEAIVRRYFSRGK